MKKRKEWKFLTNLIKADPKEMEDKANGKSYDNDRKHWTKDETAEMLEAHSLGFNDRDIAFAHKRRIKAVRLKRTKELQKLMEDAEPMVKTNNLNDTEEPGRFFSQKLINELHQQFEWSKSMMVEQQDSYDELMKEWCLQHLKRSKILETLHMFLIEETGLIGMLGGTGKVLDRGNDLLKKLRKVENSITPEEVNEHFEQMKNIAGQGLEKKGKFGNGKSSG